MSTAENRYHFLIRRVHSLLGLLPIGIFFTFHMFANLNALGGPEQYDRFIDFMRGIPGIIVVEIVVIFIPLLFHSIYGAWVVYTGQSNILKYKYVRNWFYIIQRFSGLYTLVFVAIHVYLLRFGNLSYDVIAQFVSDPLGAIFYALGVICGAFHFTNGLWAFAITWGLTIGPRSQKIWTNVLVVVFLILAAIGLADLSAFL